MAATLSPLRVCMASSSKASREIARTCAATSPMEAVTLCTKVGGGGRTGRMAFGVAREALHAGCVGTSSPSSSSSSSSS
eukprot:CAMPEP_0204061246 /NCGR_PEP_ID=MMETSP0360-20130528/141699_1 /ASSEMBLY_ACC=CAM_ASM_000342 /TAXON_ID=268821 /ORGANISM="Scrippsiella Hangoei, Strain SHTV-5" /LENGTH=78 /DNA_ID=CAMNT_0051008967 /DNA_START=47 /DNA_END=279 /DNA_ORIENTATION=-